MSHLAILSIDNATLLKDVFAWILIFCCVEIHSAGNIHIPLLTAYLLSSVIFYNLMIITATNPTPQLAYIMFIQRWHRGLASWMS